MSSSGFKLKSIFFSFWLIKNFSVLYLLQKIIYWIHIFLLFQNLFYLLTFSSNVIFQNVLQPFIKLFSSQIISLPFLPILYFSIMELSFHIRNRKLFRYRFDRSYHILNFLLLNNLDLLLKTLEFQLKVLHLKFKFSTLKSFYHIYKNSMFYYVIESLR